MNFLDTIDRAKTYLEKHSRVSLRVLKLQFDLDDAPAANLSLRQAHDLYSSIGATGHAERLARELDR
jgi:hypothetical protein